MTVRLDHVLAAARARRAALVGEMSGQLVLAAAEQLAELPRRIRPEDTELREDGTLHLGGGEACAPREVVAELGAWLDALLAASSSVGSSLQRIAATDHPSIEGLAQQLRAALIPSNPAAARRALARLYRETARAVAAGPAPALPVAAPVALPQGSGSASAGPQPASAPPLAVAPTPTPRIYSVDSLDPEPALDAAELEATRLEVQTFEGGDEDAEWTVEAPPVEVPAEPELAAATSLVASAPVAAAEPSAAPAAAEAPAGLPEVEASAGPVEVEASAGPVEVEASAGPVELEVSAGPVELEASAPPVEVEASAPPVEVEPPAPPAQSVADLSARLPQRRSRVEDLVSRFEVQGTLESEELRAGLKLLAGVELSPAPPPAR